MDLESRRKRLLDGLRAWIAKARSRFAKTPPENPATDAPAFALRDPTSVLLPSDAPADDEIAAMPLSAMLEDSARAMARRADELHAETNTLIARIGERVEGEITLRTQAARVLISVVWLGAAAWLYISGLNARADGLAVLPNGMPVDDAFVLMRTFFTTAAAGLGVAFAVAALANAFGRGDNRKVRAEAERLGFSIADTSREFDRRLTALRSEMDRRGHPADAVADLSRAHMNALEACAYFRNIAFLTSAEGPHALRLFRRFLHRKGENPPPLPVFLLGAAISFVAFYVFVYPHPEPATPPAPLAIMKYPWAMALLSFGGLAYAGIGFFFGLFGGAIAPDAAARAREEALDALRGAFTSREAPRPADVIRRIEDAVDVFRARVGGSTARRAMSETNHGAAISADAAGEDGDGPAWRRRDSSAKFVETGFQAAPQAWRADPHLDFEPGKTGSKRGVPKLKNPPRD